jgi:hypothetical protein
MDLLLHGWLFGVVVGALAACGLAGVGLVRLVFGRAK